MKKSITTLFSAAVVISSLSSHAESNHNPAGKINTYVLVHGAWQAPYVWDVVKANLERQGNKVVVIELPGHGNDNTAAHTLSIDVYRDKVVDAINKVEGKVILAGHSMGGMVITSVAEKIPARISKLVYIGAFVPASGQSLLELSQMDAGSKLGASLSESEDRLTLNVKAADLVGLFIPDGTADDKHRVTTNYRPEPSIPFTSKVTFTAANFGAVEKVYIKTENDIVISPAFQDQMIAKAGVKTVYSVPAGHSPFLAKPAAVSDLLLQIGK